MRSSQIAIAIQNCVDMNEPAMIWGPSGVGKSDTVRQAIHLLNGETDPTIIYGKSIPSIVAGLETDDTWNLIDFRAALREPVDIQGLPYTTRIEFGSDLFGTVTNYALPAGLPRKPHSKGILFCDEINSAPQQTQAALYQLMLDRQVGDYRLPDGWSIVAAGNRMGDRGVVHRMPDPLISRLIHFDYEVHSEDWTRWALGAGIDPAVIAFIRLRPDTLHIHDAKRECHAFPTPRGHAKVSKIIQLNSPVELELIKGTVGDAVAGEYAAFLSLFRNMVSPDYVVLNPTTADVPTNPSIIYALSIALARRAKDSPKHWPSIVTYARRMPQEYQAALMSSATALNQALCNTPEFIAWASAQS